MKTKPLTTMGNKTDDDIIKNIVDKLKSHSPHFDGGEAEFLIDEEFKGRATPKDINRRVRVAYDMT